MHFVNTAMEGIHRGCRQRIMSYGAFEYTFSCTVVIVDDAFQDKWR